MNVNFSATWISDFQKIWLERGVTTINLIYIKSNSIIKHQINIHYLISSGSVKNIIKKNNHCQFELWIFDFSIIVCLPLCHVRILNLKKMQTNQMKISNLIQMIHLFYSFLFFIYFKFLLCQISIINYFLSQFIFVFLSRMCVSLLRRFFVCFLHQTTWTQILD